MAKEKTAPSAEKTEETAVSALSELQTLQAEFKAMQAKQAELKKKLKEENAAAVARIKEASAGKIDAFKSAYETAKADYNKAIQALNAAKTARKTAKIALKDAASAFEMVGGKIEGTSRGSFIGGKGLEVVSNAIKALGGSARPVEICAYIEKNNLYTGSNLTPSVSAMLTTNAKGDTPRFVASKIEGKGTNYSLFIAPVVVEEVKKAA